jgi:hypothetical protein
MGKSSDMKEKFDGDDWIHGLRVLSLTNDIC